jgi:hypothetical protein
MGCRAKRYWARHCGVRGCGIARYQVRGCRQVNPCWATRPPTATSWSSCCS